MREQDVQVETGKVHLRIQEGAGTPVVFLHGLGASGHDFRDAFGAPELGGRPLVALDLPGYGKSGRPQGFSYDLKDQAEILDQVLGALDMDQVDLVAHSMGGMAAIWFARLHPEKVRRLVLAEPNLDLANAQISARIRGYGSERAFAEGYREFLDRFDKPEKPSAYGFYRTLLETEPHVLFRSAQSIKTHSTEAFYREFLELPMPVAFLQGEKSWHRLEEGMRREMEEKGVRFATVPYAGHGMMGDNPREFYRVVGMLLEP
ncbi:alpha/beta fold hydrolase [Anaerotalea alkaliphila]|uniref:Alpha/beta hydrolase n=1 Tax=Anaerotalea alkaliphila TaxID=2662126 RepID=A0A7X5HTY2_9FIRM|nr:alpha/beta hydrolase [Anaerotalea alkaliphila]NDL66598.1 alpha/beta hydrolase [Anaerotalea alkaliphila]